MRTFLFATVAAVASAAHEFNAEKNYICNMCQIAVDLHADGDVEMLEKLYSLHPKLAYMMSHYRPELISDASAKESCQNLGLCEEQSIYSLLLSEQPLDLSRHIEKVNSNPRSNWVAGSNEKFQGVSLRDAKKLMGTVVDPDWTIRLHEKKQTINGDLPESFDARTNWPECESVINHVRDQSNCGSCWAHGTTEAFNDRKCITSGGDFTTLLSVSDTTGCCVGLKCFSFGCDGGQVTTPWTFFKEQGVVTGGDYGMEGLCYDYTMPMCAHHVESETLPACGDIATVQPTCSHTCPDDSTRTYADDKHMGQSAYTIPADVEQIKAEIAANGTVTAAFTVWEDFLTYKSGVYSHQTGESLGGHAIKMIGWGTEGGEDYWLCVNSWNTTWGDQGTFKIKMGDCGINDSVAAGQV